MDNYALFHDGIKLVFSVTPAATQFLITAVNSAYPHVSLPPVHHETFIRNLLLMSDYLPQMQNSIFHLLIERLLELDSHVPGIDLALLPNTTPEAEAHNSSVSRLGSSFFLFLEKLCTLHNHALLDQVFDGLLISFENLVLPTARCKVVQFYAFYLCMLRPDYTENFLGMLMSILCKEGCSISTDICIANAGIMLGSFVARARFVDDQIVSQTFSLLLNWAVSYVTSYDEASTAIQRHLVFYAVSQSIFYIFCYRHLIFMSLHPFAFLQNSLSRIIMSSLNPLRFCEYNVVNEFSKIANHYQLIYCYSILRRNNRIAAISSRRSFFPALPLLASFPFDPIELDGCERFFPPESFAQWINPESSLDVLSSINSVSLVRTFSEPFDDYPPVSISPLTRSASASQFLHSFLME